MQGRLLFVPLAVSVDKRKVKKEGEVGKQRGSDRRNKEEAKI